MLIVSFVNWSAAPSALQEYILSSGFQDTLWENCKIMSTKNNFKLRLCTSTFDIENSFCF